jgi:hypothetical protein
MRYHNLIESTRGNSIRRNLLPLVCDLHWLAFCANWCIGSCFLGCNRTCLVLELGKGHSPDRDQSDFFETFEALEYGSKIVFVDIARNVLEEEGLVGPYVFVGDNCSSSLCCAGLLGRDCRIGLRFRILFCSLEVYTWLVSSKPNVHSKERTFLHEALPLVLIEHVGCFALDRLIAVCFRPSHPHFLAVHWEAVHSLGCLHRRLLTIEDDKSLSLALQTALSNDIENGAVALEDNIECLLHGVNLDAFLEVVDLLLLALRQKLQRVCAASSGATHVDSTLAVSNKNSVFQV